MKALNVSFFNRPTLAVARDLIGCQLVRRRGRTTERLMITEVEAYDGFRDRASHAFRGMTARNEIMFHEAGHIYIFFTYGIHWMLNIVIGEKGHPAAILIRGAQSTEAVNGPARLTKKLGITGALNGKMLSRKTGLWIEGPAEGIRRGSIIRTPRIGIDYAGEIWAAKKWRFVLKNRLR